MSLLNKASLIQIPSGYKDGTLYSAKPINGDGDFTFSRGSNLAATHVNSEGLIEKGRENLLLQSNTFDTTWAAVGINITSGQSGYDGTNDAWKIESTNTGQSRIAQTISISGVNTVSFYAKAGTANYIIPYIIGSGDPRVFFNLSAGVVETTAFNIDASIEDVGSGWYRCSMTLERTSSSLWVFIGNTDNSFNSAIGDSIYIQDAQLEQGLVSTDYIETTTTTAQAGILEDMPRLDYSGGASCPSLLLEPSRTNLITQSEYLDGWNGTSTATITTNYTTSPEGVNNATRLQFAASSNLRHEQIIAGAYESQSITVSVYAKSLTGNEQDFRLKCTHAGVADYFSNDLTATNEWQRFVFTQAFGSSTGTGIVTGIYQATDNLAKDIAFYGFQLEVSASYPTSYIPTYGSSVTKSADSCSKTGISSLIGQTEGTFYIETTPLNDVTTYTERLIKFQDGGSDVIGVNRYSNSLLNYYGGNSGGTQWSINVADVFEGSQKTKIACAYKENDIVIYVDGVQKGTDTTASIPTTDRMYFANDASGGLTYIGKHTQAILFPTRLTNDELAELTTL